MDNIDFLEHGGATSSWPFAIRHHDELIVLPSPLDHHYQWVLIALGVGHVPGTPGDLPEWKRARVFERWAAAWELPSYNDARRLAYLVDNYRAAISSDLQTFAGGLDLGDLWRARRWSLLVDVIDRLPSHSWYSASAAQDERHAKMLAESVAARQQGAAAEDRGPSLTGWTPEVAALTTLIDATRGVQHAVFAAQHGKKAGDPPKPMPRPVTALEKALKAASFNSRKAAHEALVARVLPNRRAVKS